MSIWGVGVKLIFLSFLYALIMMLVTFLYPEIFVFEDFPVVVQVFSAILLSIGIPFLVLSGRKLTANFSNNKLITDGVFKYVRNPIYSAWILFIIPALSILSSSTLVMTTPVFSYILFKILIRKEDENLEKVYGDQYREYKANVNELVPWFN
jgi:protein-S-isoprenylcysteine O-methyltransferase Ste14